MSWSSLALTQGIERWDGRWIRTVFQALYETAPPRDWDILALYVDRKTRTTFYFSPRAAARMDAAVSRYIFRPCARPHAAEIELLMGCEEAADPEWCEWSFAHRAGYREERTADAPLLRAAGGW